MKYLINFHADKKATLTEHFLAYACKGKEEGIRAVLSPKTTQTLEISHDKSSLILTEKNVLILVVLWGGGDRGLLFCFIFFPNMIFEVFQYEL